MESCRIRREKESSLISDEQRGSAPLGAFATTHNQPERFRFSLHSDAVALPWRIVASVGATECRYATEHERDLWFGGREGIVVETGSGIVARGSWVVVGDILLAHGGFCIDGAAWVMMLFRLRKIAVENRCKAIRWLALENEYGNVPKREGRIRALGKGTLVEMRV